MESKQRRFLATVALVLLLAGQANGVCIPGGEAHAHAAQCVVSPITAIPLLLPFFSLVFPASEECFSDEPIASCRTCCCKSSPRATFYNERLPEPCCRAKSVATYTVRFTATWSEECHPDYYPDGARWSEFVVASHRGSVSPFSGSCVEEARVTPHLRALAENGTTGPLLAVLSRLIDRGMVYDRVMGAEISGGRLAGEGTVHILGHIANVCRVHCVRCWCNVNDVVDRGSIYDEGAQGMYRRKGRPHHFVSNKYVIFCFYKEKIDRCLLTRQALNTYEQFLREICSG